MLLSHVSWIAIVDHDFAIVAAGLQAEQLDDIDVGIDGDLSNLGLAERSTDAGWEVTHNTTELIVTQYNEEYCITAHGTVEGDSEYRTGLENIIETEKQRLTSEPLVLVDQSTAGSSHKNKPLQQAPLCTAHDRLDR
jgi:hypothetical protein